MRFHQFQFSLRIFILNLSAVWGTIRTEVISTENSELFFFNSLKRISVFSVRVSASFCRPSKWLHAYLIWLSFWSNKRRRPKANTKKSKQKELRPNPKYTSAEMKRNILSSLVSIFHLFRVTLLLRLIKCRLTDIIN